MKHLIFVLKPISRLLLLDVLRHPDTRPIMIWGVLWILFGTVLFHWLEGWNWIDSLYFTIISLTTVGYGDFTPTTPLTKLIASFFILNGVAILLGLLDQIRKVRSENLMARVERAQKSEA